MTINKNISDIISIQHACKEIIQELYSYESRPSNDIRENHKISKLDEAIRFDIIEHNPFSDMLSLSTDTIEYYDVRLGQNTQTNIGLIGDKLAKLETELNFYNQRIKSSEPADKELKSIYLILSQIPSLLKSNLTAIASNSIFAFKSESNFEIKMDKLKISKDEISKLIEATHRCDTFLKSQDKFLKSMQNYKINTVILRFKTESIAFEKVFIKLYDDIMNFINQSIKDGKFIKKLQRLKALKDNNKLLSHTDVEEVSKRHKIVSPNQKVKKIHPDDQIYNYLETLKKIIVSREMEFKDNRIDTALKYDIDRKERVEKKFYNYQKMNEAFLDQDENLITFLVHQEIEEDRLLGVFIRMLKNYSPEYQVNNEVFITYNERKYIEVKR